MEEEEEEEEDKEENRCKGSVKEPGMGPFVVDVFFFASSSTIPTPFASGVCGRESEEVSSRRGWASEDSTEEEMFDRSTIFSCGEAIRFFFFSSSSSSSASSTRVFFGIILDNTEVDHDEIDAVARDVFSCSTEGRDTRGG